MDDVSILPRIILGSGRSGTTWVLDCVADANELRPVFEPLHPQQTTLGLRYAYQVLIPGDQDEELERKFRDLAAGRMHSIWMDYRGRRHRLFPNPAELVSVAAFKRWLRRWQKFLRVRAMLRASMQREELLIKCIRANLMAGWLTQTIGFRTVLIVRHPGAVVESQHRLGPVWDPSPVLDRYRANHKLHDVTGGHYLPLLNSRLTKSQALTLNWVIENQWPVERGKEHGYSVIYYEDLVERPDESWQHLCNSLELSRLPHVSVLSQPSQQASPGLITAEKSGQRGPSWRSRMSAGQLTEIQGILDATECDLYRVDSDDPLRSNLVQTQTTSGN